MPRKDKEAIREYQKKYYEEHIKNNEEARERKNARQREYAKKTGYKTNNEYNKRTYKSYSVNFRTVEDAEIIELIENEKAQGDNTTEVFRKLFLKILKKD